jgi:hypothetical protein
MEKDYSGIHYGLGETLDEAFNDYLSRIDDIDRKHKEYVDSIPPLTEEEKERLHKVLEKPLSNLFGGPPIVGVSEFNGPIGTIVYLDYKYSGATMQNTQDHAH